MKIYEPAAPRAEPANCPNPWAKPCCGSGLASTKYRLSVSNTTNIKIDSTTL